MGCECNGRAPSAPRTRAPGQASHGGERAALTPHAGRTPGPDLLSPNPSTGTEAQLLRSLSSGVTSKSGPVLFLCSGFSFHRSPGKRLVSGKYVVSLCNEVTGERDGDLGGERDGKARPLEPLVHVLLPGRRLLRVPVSPAPAWAPLAAAADGGRVCRCRGAYPVLGSQAFAAPRRAGLCPVPASLLCPHGLFRPPFLPCHARLRPSQGPSSPSGQVLSPISDTDGIPLFPEAAEVFADFSSTSPHFWGSAVLPWGTRESTKLSPTIRSLFNGHGEERRVAS